MKDTAAPPPFTIGIIAVVESDQPAAEMLHTFFRLMEIEAVMVSPCEQPAETVAATICRAAPQAVVVDFDLPDLLALEIATAIRAAAPALPLIFTTRRPTAFVSAVDGASFTRRPGERFEELLVLLEAVLETVDG
jgi:DNA-binding response OmpR family regulator